jgi:hypothetical protein
MFDTVKYSTNVGTSLLYENELCRCWDSYLDRVVMLMREY